MKEKLFLGARGWTDDSSEEDYKIQRRECERLKLSLEDGILRFGDDKEIIVFMHHPPFYKEEVPEEIDYIKLMKKYNVKRCYYGHLHSEAQKDAIEGNIDGIDFKLISSDHLNFDLLKI